MANSHFRKVITLFIPGLLDQVSGMNEADIQANKLTTLLKMTRFSRVEKLNASNYEVSLGQLMGGDNAPPIPAAALGCSGEHFQTDGQYWLRIDPMLLYPDVDRLLLFDSVNLNINQDEADALTLAINQEYTPEHWQVHAATPENWYLCLPEKPKIKTTSPLPIFGKHIYDYLPNGEDKRKWRNHFNEIQMLLHQHPVNQAREQHAKSMINTVWFWGEGQLADFKPTQYYQAIWSNDAVMKGVAKMMQSQYEVLPSHADDCLDKLPAGETLICLDHSLLFMKSRDITVWQQSAISIEQNWLHPLMIALAHNRIDEIRMLARPDCLYTLKKKDTWKFWKKKTGIH